MFGGSFSVAEEYDGSMRGSDSNASQGFVRAGSNEVWTQVWKKDLGADPQMLFKHRLFIEGYPVFKRYSPKDATNVLDIGTGSGRYGIKFALDYPLFTVYLTDLLESSLDVARKNAVEVGATNVHIQKEDMFHLSFRDNTFDLVFCDVVIQHVLEPERAVHEMLRVLKPEGTFIVSTMNRWNFHSLYKLSLRLIGKPYPYGYEKSYTRRELAALVTRCGGRVIAQDGFYVAYGIFRLRNVHPVFGGVGKIINRLVTYIDRYSDRWLSKRFGFEIFCVASK